MIPAPITDPLELQRLKNSIQAAVDATSAEAASVGALKAESANLDGIVAEGIKTGTATTSALALAEGLKEKAAAAAKMAKIKAEEAQKLAGKAPNDMSLKALATLAADKAKEVADVAEQVASAVTLAKVNAERIPSLPAALPDPPNAWNIINDYSKTILTLASGLLALTATFGGQIIGTNRDGKMVAAVGLTWLFLIFTIGCGLYTQAHLTHFLRYVQGDPKALTPKKYCLLSARGALLFFFLASAGLVAIAVLRFAFPSVAPTTDSYQKAVSYVKSLNQINAQNVDGQCQLVKSQMAADETEIDLEDIPKLGSGTGQIVKYHVVVSKGGDIVSCERR